MKNLILIIWLIIPVLGQAQQKNETENVESKKKEKLERIESYKIGFISQKLELTSKEAEVFWPVFNRYEAEIGKIRKQLRELNKTHAEKSLVQEAEANQYITTHLLLKQQETETLKKYVPEFKKVLPTIKVAKLLSLEQEFKMKLLQQIREDKPKN